MTGEHLHTLQHALGVDQYGRGEHYRNRFVTGPGSNDFQICVELCDLGLMMDHGPQRIAAGDHCFTVTEEGKKAMSENSPNPPKVSRSKQRYLDYLSADTDFSFGEWLKFGLYKRTEQPI